MKKQLLINEISLVVALLFMIGAMCSENNYIKFAGLIMIVSSYKKIESLKKELKEQ